MKLKALITCCMLSVLLWADQGTLVPSDRLSSSLIRCITQDQYGLIWVGTEYGLSRYDGYHFTNYLHNDKDTTTINSNTITSFLVDRQGRFFVGTSKGIAQYDYSTNSFHRYNLPRPSQPRIYDMIEDKQGNILAGSAGFGLFEMKKGSGNFVREKQYSRRDSDEFFTHLYIDPRGQLWQSSHLSVFTRFVPQGGKIRFHDYKSAWGAPVAFIPEGKKSMLVICMFGIARYDFSTDKLTDAGFDLGTFKGDITINTAMRDNKGDIFLGTSEHGILIIPSGKRQVEYYEGAEHKPFDIHSSYVTSIFEDKDHNLWAGCYQKGLYLDNHEQKAFRSWDFATQNYSIGSSVSSIAPGGNGDMWCTVQNSGVYHFDADGNITAHPQSPAGASIIYRDHKGSYWIGTNNGLYSYNPQSGASTPCLRFESAGVYSILDDGHGKLYLSVYSKGLYIYDTKTRKVTIYNMEQRGPKGYLCNDWIRSMTFDRRGLLWIATSSGVSCFDPKTGSFRPLGWHNLLQDVLTNAVCEYDDGNIVIGSDRGLYIYDFVSKRVKPFPHSDMLDNKQICAIVKDFKGNLWMSTTMGIWQYNKRTHQFFSYIRGNGLASHEYMLGSVIHFPNDDIAFGYSDGITSFSPSVVNRTPKEAGMPFLTDFIVNGKSRNFRRRSFKVAYSENSFTLEFSLLNYKRSEDISFTYSINNGPWLTTSEGINQIPFTKLEPGRYRIEVKAVCNGVVSKAGNVLTIQVLQPWYNTWLAWFIYIAVAGGIVFYLSLAYKRKKQADLDDQKMRFLIDATHDIRSPLTLILGPLKKLKSRLTDKEDRRDLETIDRNANRLLLLVNQILDERKIDKGQMQLHCEETDLVDFAAHAVRLYQYGAQERGIVMHLVDNKGRTLGLRHKPVNVWIDRVNFDKVLSNLLSNAFKYTFDGGEIDIIVEQNDKMVSLKVVDTGIGFKEQKTDRLFDRFYQSSTASDLHIEGTGIGLNLCRNIVLMHGGMIKAYNRKDGKRGACVEVCLHTGNAHLKPEQIVEPEKEEEKPVKAPQPTRNIHILVVDDDYEIPRYISSELGRWYHFDSAVNGKVAMQKLLTEDYDLVISDVMMPEMDGITLLKNIKGNPRVSDIPVILLTSKNEVGNRLEGLRRGADAFMAKPFAIDELHILIENLMNNINRLRGKYSGAQEQKDKVENVTVKGNNDALMERIMKSVNDHISDTEFSVEKLAEDVGVSRAQLHRKMKEITGISTSEFVRNIRLEQAAKLISEGNVNITQVAYAVGFVNQAHFSTVFKKHFGVSPSEYNQERKE